MNNFWDTRYDTPQYVYGKEPNRFFESEIAKLTPGRLLLPGEGEGRNAVFAAYAGWNVDAFDQSEVGAVKSRDLASEKGVEINYRVSQMESYPFGVEKFDVVGLIFFHLPPPLRRKLHQQVIGSLKPGGQVILEAFHTSQLANNTGGPQSPEMLYDRETIMTDFAQLDTLMYTEMHISLDEGPFHQGGANVIRYSGKKTK